MTKMSIEATQLKSIRANLQQKLNELFNLRDKVAKAERKCKTLADSHFGRGHIQVLSASAAQQYPAGPRHH